MEGVLEGNISSSIEFWAGMGGVLPVQAEKTGEAINLAEVAMNTCQGVVVDSSTAANSAGSVAKAPVVEEEDNNNPAGKITPSQPVTKYEKPCPRQRNLKRIEDIEEQFDNIHTSDDQLGPFWGAIMKEVPQLFDNDDDKNYCLRELVVEDQSNMEANTESNAETNVEMNTKKKIWKQMLNQIQMT